MLKWLTLLLLVGIAHSLPGVYDEYTYDDEGKEGDGDGDYYLYYDEDESNESDIDDEELKKITDAIADYSYEDEAPQKGRPGNGQKKNKPAKNKQRSKRSADEGPVAMYNRKAWEKHREGSNTGSLSRPKRFLDSLRLDKIILPVIKEVFQQNPTPLNKEARDKISGGYFGWQYAMLSEDCCSCKDTNICSCCPSTNITGSNCVNFKAEPNRAQVSIDIGSHRHVEITVAKNSRSMGCEHANLKDICLYSHTFTTTKDGYKACIIITNNVKDPKSGVLKCINYTNEKTTITDS